MTFKKLALTAAAVLCAGYMSTASAQIELGDDGYYASGYFRWGTLVDDKGNVNWGPTWKRYTGALSNEDNSWELTLGRHLKGYDGLWANIQSTLKGNMGTNYVNTFRAEGYPIATAQDWGNKNLYLDGAVVEIGGIDPNSDLSFWAGKGGVAKDNYDYLTDIFYTDYSGVGGGVKNLYDRFDIAYLQNVIEWEWNADPAIQEQQRNTINSLYARYNMNDWHFDFLYNYNSRPTFEETESAAGQARYGYEVTATYESDSYYFLGNGKSTYAVQYAKGVTSGWLTQDMINPWATKDNQSYRFLTFGQTKTGNTTIINQLWLTKDRAGNVSNLATQDFLRGAATVRAVYPFGPAWAVLGEVGGGFERNTSNSDGSETAPTKTWSKVSGALQLGAPTPQGFYPNIKFEVAYHGGNQLKATDKSEFRAGIQAEINMPGPANPFTGY